MAFAAMAGAFDQIAAGKHRLRRACGKREHRLIAQIKQLPQADAAADVEGEAELVTRRLALHRRQRFQEGIEVGDVGGLHPCIGG